jgi:hypothetical protein
MSSKPFRSFYRSIATAFLTLLSIEATSRHAQAQSFPVTLELLAPSSGGNKIPTVTWGGWPLILKMTAHREIGIGWTGRFDFPVNSAEGFVFSAIVFEEPDDCHSWSEGCEVNETYLEFCPGGASFTCSPAASLVLLADAGEGENGVNLASHFNNVGYELDDVGNRTNVVASMVVPNGLVTPPVTTDLCVGESQKLAQFRGELLSFDALLTILNASNITTLRAFVVNRTAPAQLSDLNADGVVSARDAELSGLRLLSREVVFRVRTLHQIAEFDFAPHADLDRNGVAGPCPPPLKPCDDDIVCDDGLVCTRDRCDPFFGDPGFGVCVHIDDCAPGGGGLTPVPR